MRVLLVGLLMFPLLIWVAVAGELPAPPPLQGEPVAEVAYLAKIYENWHRLDVSTVNPNTAPARRGLRGEVIYATFGGTNRLCANTSTTAEGGTTWQCVSLSTP